MNLTRRKFLQGACATAAVAAVPAIVAAKPVQLHPLGARRESINQDASLMYVRAGEALPAYRFCQVTENCTAYLAGGGPQGRGIQLAALSVEDIEEGAYGWIAISGLAYVQAVGIFDKKRGGGFEFAWKQAAVPVILRGRG